MQNDDARVDGSSLTETERATAQFTPGPWVLDTWGDECGDQFDLRMGDAVGNDFSHDAAHKIELYSGADAEGCPEQYAEMRANSNLIAASPDLYASTQELRKALAIAMRILATDDGLADAFVDELASLGIADGIGVRAHDAIAKAEGK
jgi:hypothetical protein